MSNSFISLDDMAADIHSKAVSIITGRMKCTEHTYINGEDRNQHPCSICVRELIYGAFTPLQHDLKNKLHP